jgi:hypothetical protein
MKTLHSVLILAGAAIAGCGSEPSKPTPISAPEVASVSPTRASNTDTATVVIRGSGFAAGAVALVGIRTLTGAVLVSPEEIRGVVPSGISTGLYGVRVRNRDGGTGTLASAFRVTGPGMTHNGEISEDEIWQLRDSPHVVSGEVQVRGSSSPALTIEAGCRVLFQNGARLVVGDGAPGRLIASGETGGIEFTSSLSPGNEERGSWGNVALFGDSSAVLRNCRFRFGGGPTLGGLPPCLLLLTNASAMVDDCLFEESAGAGLHLGDESALLSFSGCTFRRSSGPHLSLRLERSKGLAAGHLFDDGIIEIRPGTMAGDLYWPGAGAAYRIGANLVLRGTLTLGSGVALEFASGIKLEAGVETPGGLVAAGEEGAPVRFRSDRTQPAPGAWAGLHFGPLLLSGSRLDHTEIRHAGGSGQPAAVVCDGAAPRIQDSRVESSASLGVIYRAGARPVSFVRNVIVGSATHAIELPASGLAGIAADNSFSGNGAAGLIVDGGVVTESGLWSAFGLSSPYLIRGDIEIRAASRPIVTVTPGATLRFQSGCGLLVGAPEGSTESGALVVERGTAPTILTSPDRPGVPQQPGDWEGIVFLDTSDDETSRLEGCVVEYGGAGGLGNVRCRNASPVLRDVLLQWSAGYGLYLEGASEPDTAGVTCQFNTLGAVGP